MRPITGFRAALTSFLALGLGLSVSACASLPDAGFGQEERSVYGSYLAARYAGSSRDLEASSELYAQALNKAPDSSLISQRAFFAALVAGDFERAVHIFAHPAAALFVGAIQFGGIDVIFGRMRRAALGNFLRNPVEQLLQRIAGQEDAVPRLGVATRR